MNRRNYSVFLLLLLLLLSSCKDWKAEEQAEQKKLRAEARYGIEYDSVRAELGIPTMSSSWQVLKVDPRYEDYIKYDQDPYHKYKYVYIDEEGRIEKEVDMYQTGQKYDNEIGEGPAFYLWVIYDYKAEGEKFTYWYTDPDNWKNLERTEITKEQADSLMTSWGISYDG